MALSPHPLKSVLTLPVCPFSCCTKIIQKPFADTPSPLPPTPRACPAACAPAGGPAARRRCRRWPSSTACGGCWPRSQVRSARRQPPACLACVKSCQQLQLSNSCRQLWLIGRLTRMCNPSHRIADKTMERMQPFATALGRAAGCDPWAVEIFAEEVVRVSGGDQPAACSCHDVACCPLCLSCARWIFSRLFA